MSQCFNYCDGGRVSPHYKGKKKSDDEIQYNSKQNELKWDVLFEMTTIACSMYFRRYYISCANSQLTFNF